MTAIAVLALSLALLATSAAGEEMLVYSNDFEGEVGPEWSDTVTDITPIGARRFLGKFGSESVSLTLGGLPAHGSLTISFDLFIIHVPHLWQKEYLIARQFLLSQIILQHIVEKHMLV